MTTIFIFSKIQESWHTCFILRILPFHSTDGNTNAVAIFNSNSIGSYSFWIIWSVNDNGNLRAALYIQRYGCIKWQIYDKMITISISNIWNKVQLVSCKTKSIIASISSNSHSKRDSKGPLVHIVCKWVMVLDECLYLSISVRFQRNLPKLMLYDLSKKLATSFENQIIIEVVVSN